tara:strand:+ start:273 stop:1448 length:1176 start_codon:yes stop_codon:yes gene_type:complete
MKKKIAILGSTGSIGRASLNIIDRDIDKFKIVLLTANSNYSKIKKQILKYKPTYFVINNTKVFLKIKKKFKKKKIKFYNNLSELNLSNKIFDITISAIVGFAGLKPTIKFTPISKKILLANKEAIICGWHIINQLSKKNKTKIILIDSEHFSIDQLTENYKNEDIKKIYITASGGPFLRKPLKNFSKITPIDAANHPNWKMGKKISIDSASLMNKVLELIEAYKFFPFDPKKYEILIHPQSLIHSIVVFNNGQIKFLYHETDMKIPIANAIYGSKINIKKFKIKKGNFIENLKSIKFERVDKKRFPIVTLLKKNIYKNSIPIILNASNEILVESFLNKKISFNSIYQCIKHLFRDRDFNKYAIKRSPNINEIYKIDKWARDKTVEIIESKL